MRNLAILAAALMASAMPSAASAQLFTGTTVGAPEYFGGFENLAVPFYVTMDGTYTFLQSSTQVDSFLTIFTNFVDPTDMEVNLIGFDDDNGGGSNALVIIPLVANQQYIALLGAFESGDVGEVQLTITGPADVTFGTLAGAIPEPATWAMMIGGFALAGAAMRRRATVVSYA